MLRRPILGKIFLRRREFSYAAESEKTSQSGIHDQRGCGVVSTAPANIALVRARGTTEAVPVAGKHPALHGLGSRATGSDSHAGARHGRESGGDRDHLEYAGEDDRDGTADGRGRAEGAAGIVAHGDSDG